MLRPTLFSRVGARVALAALVLFATLLTFPRAAHANGLTLGVDAEAEIPVAPDGIDTGAGFAARLGYQLHLPLFTLTPEIGFHYAKFDSTPALYRGIAGARVGFGEGFRIGAYGHVGFAHQTWEVLGADSSFNSASFDLGAFIDFTLLPFLNIGVHGGYAWAGHEGEADDLQWVPLGAHAALMF